MPGKPNLPRSITKEIDLFSFLGQFPHLAKTQDYKMKGVGSTLIRMSHTGMSFGEYYEHLKCYSGIADVEIRPARKRFFRPNDPFTVIIFDKIHRDTYLEDRVDSSSIKVMIEKFYALANPKTVGKIIQSIPDGEYAIDRKYSLKEDERFERRKYRYLFLYSTGDKLDLKNCMLAYRLSSEEIVKALKCGVWVREEPKEEDIPDDADVSGGAKSSEKRLILNRFDIYYTLRDLRKIVLRKAEGLSHDAASGQSDHLRRGAEGTRPATLPCKE